MNAKAQTGFACPCATGTNDYNVDAAGRTLSTIISDGDIPASLPTGSCVAILGEMIVNRTYLMDNVTLRMQPGAEIVLNQPSSITTTLTIRDSDISGCDTMWRAITVRRGVLNFENNDISDAQWAIRGGCGESPTCTGNRTLNITESRFDRNHIGVQTRSTGNAFPALSYSMTIHSDTFTCSANLLPKFDNNTIVPNYLQTDAYAAFDMNSSTSNFNIGSTNASESILISSDENNGIRNGIIIRRCNVDINIRNTDIIDPVGGVGTGTVNLASPEGIGILLDGSDGNPVVTITEGSTFAADRGIHSANCRFTATDNAFDEDFIAIRHSGSRPVEISDNTFTDYEFMGVRIESSNAISNLLIDNNSFAHSHPVFQNPTTTPNSTAIAIIGTDGTNGGSGDKTISNNTLDIDAQDVAISVLADARFSIESNNVAYGSGGSGFSNQQGIIHIEGNDNYLYDNHIVEDINTKPGNSYSVIAGENNVLCCNSTERSTNGVYFWGACDNSKLRHTEFGEHFRALFCDAATLIGTQPYAANLWPTVTPPGTQDVEHLGINAEVTGSQFTIPPPMAAPFWPDNIHTPNATSVWFDSQSGSNPSCETDELCESPLMLLGGGEEELTENNRFAAEGSYEHERYGEMLNWETRRSLYAKLERSPGLLGQEESIDDFYATASDAAIGDFHSVWEAAKSIGQLTAEEVEEIAILEDVIGEKSAALSEIDHALFETEDTEEINELESGRETLVEAIAEANAAIAEIMETEKARSEELAASLYTQNETLEAAILPAQNEKALNRVLFEMAAEGTRELSEEQFEVVTAIANQCPLDGGHSVYRARAIYELKQPGGFSDSLLCLQTQELARPSAQGFIAQNNRTSVFPNPGANELSVRIPGDLTGNTISLRLNTLTGQPALYFERESAETLQKLDVSGQAAGVYLLTVLVDWQVIGTHKIILIK